MAKQFVSGFPLKIKRLKWPDKALFRTSGLLYFLEWVDALTHLCWRYTQGKSSFPWGAHTAKKEVYMDDIREI